MGAAAAVFAFGCGGGDLTKLGDLAEQNAALNTEASPLARERGADACA